MQSHTRRIRHVILAGLAIAVSICFVFRQTSGFSGIVERQYVKKEFHIPMRDGVRLFAAVYSPRDTSRSYPIMLHRTPYGIAPYGEDRYPSMLGPSMELQSEGFIFVYQDVRGRMMSEGEFVNMTPHRPVKKGRKDIDEASDAYDTIDWLLRNIPNNNGRVGMWGISYPGFYAAAGMIDAHPALKAVSPQAPIADWFIGDDFHHNGAFFLSHAFSFLSSFGRQRQGPTTRTEPSFVFPTQDGYEFYLSMGPLSEANRKYLKNEISFWNDIMKHDAYDDFWQSRNILPHLKNIGPAVMTVGGWFDAEDLFGPLGVYQSVEASSPDAYNVLVMGPWYHGAWAHSAVNYLGEIYVGTDTSEFYRREIEYPFFMRFLKDAKDPGLPEAYIFDTGLNEWKKESVWPPKPQAPARKLQLCSGGRLLWDACGDRPKNAGVNADAFDEYVSDPSRPVPYMNSVPTGMAREYMVADQRFAAGRPDVLVYSTDPLDRDVSLRGPVSVSLNVSTTGTDADFIVKLIDVYPDEYDSERYKDNPSMKGYQRLVRGEPFRGRFRNGFSRPEPFVPGRVEKIEYVMPDIAHTFRRGHRIMVQIQSSWFPLIDRNPQKFVNIRKASARDFQEATQRIFHSPDRPSYISLVFGNAD
ncbi:MAG: CocE/NonD family hydrolase [Acidobacteriota bacterium]|jgi:putative CocE/NonD family hydrolase|nr:CocE/NonD family hydrolase [Acidobacteriota bacterium]